MLPGDIVVDVRFGSEAAASLMHALVGMMITLPGST